MRSSDGARFFCAHIPCGKRGAFVDLNVAVFKEGSVLMFFYGYERLMALFLFYNSYIFL